MVRTNLHNVDIVITPHSEIRKIWFIRKRVERVIRLTGFPLKTCGNDEQKKALKIVILGPWSPSAPPEAGKLDPGIQGVFNLNTKDTKIFITGLYPGQIFVNSYLNHFMINYLAGKKRK